MNNKCILKRYETNCNKYTSPACRRTWKRCSYRAIPASSDYTCISDGSYLSRGHYNNKSTIKVRYIQHCTSNNTSNVCKPVTSITNLLPSRRCTSKVLKCNSVSGFHTEIIINSIEPSAKSL